MCKLSRDPKTKSLRRSFTRFFINKARTPQTRRTSNSSTRPCRGSGPSPLVQHRVGCPLPPTSADDVTFSGSSGSVYAQPCPSSPSRSAHMAPLDSLIYPHTHTPVQRNETSSDFRPATGVWFLERHKRLAQRTCQSTMIDINAKFSEQLPCTTGISPSHCLLLVPKPNRRVGLPQRSTATPAPSLHELTSTNARHLNARTVVQVW